MITDSDADGRAAVTIADDVHDDADVPPELWGVSNRVLLVRIWRTLAAICDQLGVIVSEDAAVQAVTSDLVAGEQVIEGDLSTVKAALDAAVADEASGQLQPATLQALQTAQQQWDTLVTTANADAAAASPPPAPTTPPAPSTPVTGPAAASPDPSQPGTDPAISGSASPDAPVAGQ